MFERLCFKLTIAMYNIFISIVIRFTKINYTELDSIGEMSYSCNLLIVNTRKYKYDYICSHALGNGKSKSRTDSLC